MNTYPYIWVALCVLAASGFTMAMVMDMKPDNKSTNTRWVKWMLLMGVLALIDIICLRVSVG